MNLKLIIEGSPAHLAAILASLPNSGGTVTPAPQTIGAQGGEAVTPATLTTEDDDTSGDAPAQAGQLDKDGLPHDIRIHSETPTLTSKGLWRKRRGVDNDTIAQVEAILRARLAGQPSAPAPNPVTPPQPAPVAPAPAAVTPVQPMPVPQPAPTPAPVAPQPMPMPAPQAEQPAPAPAPVAPQPMPTPAPVAPAPAPQTTEPTAIDFGSFMSHLTQKMGAQVVTQDHLTGYCAELSQAFQTQVNSITDIAANQNMVTYAVQLLQRDGRW